MKNIITKTALLALTLITLGISKVNAQCSSSFTASVTGYTVTFTNTSSSAPFFYMATWSFGDGTGATTGASAGTSHTYSSPGVYTICLTVADSMGGSCGTFCDSVYITGSGGTCDANFTYTTDSLVAPCDVMFTDLSTSSAGIAGWSWDFGDGGTSYLANPTHTYAGSGPWTVTLWTISLDSCVDTYTTSILTPGCGGGGPSCAASYYWYHDSTGAYTIILVNTSTGGPATSYSWSFGDGTGSTSAYPSHVYAGAGTYTVCLTITDLLCTSTYCDSLAVTYKTATPFSINVISPLTGVKEEVKNLEFTVFPNPFQGELNVNLAIRESGAVSMQLVDIAGRVVSSQNEGFLSAGSHKARISTGDLAPGMYLLRITAGNETFTQKVIAQ